MKFEHKNLSKLSAFAQSTLRRDLHDHGWKQGDNVPDTEWQMLVEKAQDADYIRLEAARFQNLVDHWCPENLHHEGMPNTLMRAFMSATACCADQKRQLDGVDPIRPLDSYPDPMYGFSNTPSGTEPPVAQHPSNRWNVLRRYLLTMIDTLDKSAASNSSMVEPRWWLEMMEVQRLLRKTDEVTAAEIKGRFL